MRVQEQKEDIGAVRRNTLGEKCEVSRGKSEQYFLHSSTTDESVRLEGEKKEDVTKISSVLLGRV